MKLGLRKVFGKIVMSIKGTVISKRFTICAARGGNAELPKVLDNRQTIAQHAETVGLSTYVV